MNAYSVSARPLQYIKKIDKAQKRCDVYRLLFTLQLQDGEFNDNDEEIIDKTFTDSYLHSNYEI